MLLSEALLWARRALPIWRLPSATSACISYSLAL